MVSILFNSVGFNSVSTNVPACDNNGHSRSYMAIVIISIILNEYLCIDILTIHTYVLTVKFWATGFIAKSRHQTTSGGLNTCINNKCRCGCDNNMQINLFLSYNN